MKNLILFLLMPFSVLAQSELTTSNFEKIESSYSSFSEKMFYDIGKVKGLKFQVVKLTNILKKESIKSLRLEYVYKTQYTSDTKVAVLDADEIDGLLSALKYIQTTVLPETRNEYCEITFKSRSGFRAGVYFDFEKLLWKPFLQLKQFDSNSSVFLPIEDFPSLILLINKANESIKL